VTAPTADRQAEHALRFHLVAAKAERKLFNSTWSNPYAAPLLRSSIGIAGAIRA
jgi:hypothetical protein